MDRRLHHARPGQRVTRDPIAYLRALAAVDPAAAWRASLGPLRDPWLRHAHAVACADHDPPTLAAWAAAAGCGVSTLRAARTADVDLRQLRVAPVGHPTEPTSRRSQRAARRAAG